jgi:hypothetical protein
MAYVAGNLSDVYGTVDKYFLDELAKMGYTGPVLQANQAALGYNPETGGGEAPSYTQLSPEFLKWAEANGVSTAFDKGSDQTTAQLLQNGNVMGQETYTTKSGLDKFAEVAVPLAISIGAGGVFGQGLGLINPGLNPLDPTTWSAGSAAGGAGELAGWDAAMADLAAAAPMTPEAFAAGGAAAGAGGSMLGGALPEIAAPAGSALGGGIGGAATGATSGLGGLLGGAGSAAGGILDWLKANPKLGGALLGGLLGGSGGGSSGGGYSYNGPMPTISRGGWKPQAQAQLMPVQNVAPALNLNQQGQQNSGLLRYLKGG